MDIEKTINDVVADVKNKKFADNVIANAKDIFKNKYACFNGRAGRKEFWYFTLVTFTVFFGGLVLNSLFGLILSLIGLGLLGTLISLIYFLISIALFLPSLGVTIRRLHDTDRSGWFAALAVTIIGAPIVLFLCMLEGTKGANQYGEEPIKEESAPAKEEPAKP